MLPGLYYTIILKCKLCGLDLFFQKFYQLYQRLASFFLKGQSIYFRFAGQKVSLPNSATTGSKQSQTAQKGTGTPVALSTADPDNGFGVRD